MFHQTLIAACGNDRLIQMIDQFEKQTSRYRITVLASKGRLRESTRKHAALLQSYKDGDAEKAELLRKQSILEKQVMSDQAIQMEWVIISAETVLLSVTPLSVPSYPGLSGVSRSSTGLSG